MGMSVFVFVCVSVGVCVNVKMNVSVCEKRQYDSVAIIINGISLLLIPAPPCF